MVGVRRSGSPAIKANFVSFINDFNSPFIIPV